jgi:hypothetical protein
MGCKKQGAKKQGHCYSEKRKGSLTSFLYEKQWPCFLHPAFYILLFAPHILAHFFFQDSKPTLFFKTRIVGTD